MSRIAKTRPNVMISVTGDQGAGKTLLLNYLMAVLPDLGIEVIEPERPGDHMLGLRVDPSSHIQIYTATAARRNRGSH